jgi:hypothetical protein
MSETVYAIDKDLKEAQAMAKGLVPYVYENELYGKMSGSMPSLTVGALLLRLRRLRELQADMSDSQLAQLADIEARHDAVRRDWAVAYEGKLVREATSRLDSMRAYFDECAQSRQLCAGAYLPEALKRTMVEEIRLTMKAHNLHSAELDGKVRSTDSHLRRYIQPSEFIWAAVLEPVYPQDTFWWLYNRPQAG